MSEAVFDADLIGLNSFRANPLYIGITGKGQAVAVIDSGFDLNHPAFGKKFSEQTSSKRVVFSYDFSGSNDSDAGYGQIKNFHGTHVAGIIGSQDAFNLGIAPECDLILLKIFDDTGTAASDNDANECLSWLAQNQSKFHLAAVNMSFGKDGDFNQMMDSVYSPAFQSLTDSRVACVAAAGNAGKTNAVSNFAADTRVIGVAATSGDNLAPYSNRSTSQGLIDIAAPGAAIAPIPDDSYGVSNGTSMAAPVISGAIALISQLACEITGRSDYKMRVGQIIDFMTGSADKVFDPKTNYFFDRINIEKFADAVVSYHKTGISFEGKMSYFGWRGDDNLIGSEEDDLLKGNDGSDTLFGMAGRDLLMGQEGDDCLAGGKGDDLLYGEGGKDIADYSNLNSGIVAWISLDASAVWDTYGEVTGSESGLDRLYSVDIIRGTSAGDDIAGLEIYGLGGDDRLNGFDSHDDIIDGGSGGDTMAGGSGNDTYYADNENDIVFEGDFGGIDAVYSAASYVLTSAQHIEKLVLINADATDAFSVVGNEYQNELVGNNGNNVLSGMSGADTMIGMRGDDFYVVTDPGDSIIELSDEGTDTIYAHIDLTMSDNIERVVANSASSGLVLHGNSIANDMTGSKGNDVLDGDVGADQLGGLLGDDIYYVDDIDDVCIEEQGAGIDTVYSVVSYSIQKTFIENLDLIGANNLNGIGNSGANVITGNDGANVLNGASGADTMIGGAGNDTYIVDDAGDSIVENARADVDRVRTSVDYTLEAGQSIEFLTVLSQSDRFVTYRLTGNELNQTLEGSRGDDILDGKGGVDTLFGSEGNDTYIVDDARDQVFEAEGGGTDIVGALKSYVLAAGQHVEILRLMLATGNQNLDLTGNERDQALIGNGGNNTLSGGGGSDTMTGGGGSDIYLVDSFYDRVFEARGGGTDRVFLTSTFYLAAGQEVETLQLLAATGTAKLNVAGNAFGQTIVGNAGINVLDGKSGLDVLTGGRGADSFVFSTALGTTNVDRITDFAAEDTIRLSKAVFTALAPGQLAASAFKNISTGTADGDDRILYRQATGEVFYDADGSGAGAAVKFAVLDNKATLTHADFVV